MHQNSIIGIDPGTDQTAYVIWNGKTVAESSILPNKEMLELVRGNRWDGLPMFVEMIASFGMPVGKEVFNTVLWIGRFCEVWDIKEQPWKLVYRQDIKLHLCQSVRAKDSNVAQALRDRFGPVGTKKQKGALYGIKSHLWSALAVAVYAFDTVKSA
jgi:hypothetical protein